MLPFLWLADVLRAAGLDVVEYPGWRERTAKLGTKTTWGVLCHHDAVAARPSRARITPGIIAHGHADLSGPISQLLITDDCKVHVIAAGRANHAGVGLIPGTLYTSGNAHLLGIEVNNDGVGEQWSAPLLETYLTTVAACLRHLGLGAERAIAHKEFALPRGRKIDPFGPWSPFWHRAPFPGQSWAQMGRWRDLVAERIDELTNPPAPAPRTLEDDMPQPIYVGSPTLDGRYPFLELVADTPGQFSIVGHLGAKVHAPKDASQAEAFERQITTLTGVDGRVLGWARIGDAVVIATDRSKTYQLSIR